MKFLISGEISDLQKEDLIPEKSLRISRKVEDKLNQNLSENDYGDAINYIFLAPMILQDNVDFYTRIKERKVVRRKEKSTDFRLRIDYLKFASADDSIREKMLLKNIIDAVRIIHQRTRRQFNGEKL
jgi:Immunity protein 44